MALANVSPLSLSTPSLPPPSSPALLRLRPTRLLFTANSSSKKSALFAANGNFRTTDAIDDAAGENDAVAAGENDVVEEDAIFAAEETRLYSVAPLPLLFLAGLPGAATVRSVFAPAVEIVKSLDLPNWLVHWGHPANMAVVLFAMGGYGTYLGFRIRFSDDVEEKAKAKDLHPKLLGGMFFFFALGATGGVTSLLTSDKPIFESPHAVTGIIGLLLLSTQSALPTLFEGNPGLRSIHGILGSGIMALFLVHAALGLQLGLSS